MGSFAFRFFFLPCSPQNASLLLCKCLSNNLFFFSASAQLELSGDDDELLMDVFFCSASFHFVFYVFLAVRIHFCYSTFILLPSSRCRAIEICLWNHCDSHLDYDVSISDSNYEFTIFNGAVWGSAVERTDDERAQLAGKCQFSCSPQISWHQHESPEKCIYAIKYFVCCLRLRKQSTISIKSSAPAQNPESIERELQAERFFSGPSVYENGS